MIEMLKKMGLALAVISALSVNVSAGTDAHEDHANTEEVEGAESASDAE